MGKMIKPNTSSKASVCSNGNCLTVFGDTAQFINAVAILATTIIAAVAVVKVLRKL
jgi:hypothetical protein